jgi:hypothetical protein
MLAAVDGAQQSGTDIHHCAAFGLAGAALGIEEDATLLAYGHQTLANLISACQRLLPVGQTQAGRMLWELKPVLVELVRHAQENGFEVDEPACFAPLVEMGSMRHPILATRLFICLALSKPTEGRPISNIVGVSLRGHLKAADERDLERSELRQSGAPTEGRPYNLGVS